MNRSLCLACAVALTALTVSSACFANPADHTVRAVTFADLDLTTQHGVGTLHRRIEIAANAVCLDASGPSPASRVDPACKRDALLSAREQLERTIAEQRVAHAASAAGNN